MLLQTRSRGASCGKQCRLNDKGAGFRCDTNKITIIDRSEAVSYPLKRKQEVAEDIVDKLSSLFHS